MNVSRKPPSASPPVSAQPQQRGPHQYPYQGDRGFARQPTPTSIPYSEYNIGQSVPQEELQLRTVYPNQLISQQPGYQTAPHAHDMSKSLQPTHVASQSSVQNQASSAHQQTLQMMYQNPQQSQQPRAANPGYIQPQQQVRPNIRQTQPRPQLQMQSAGQQAVYAGTQMPLMISSPNQHFQQIQIVQQAPPLQYTTRPGMPSYTMTQQPYTVQQQPPGHYPYQPQQGQTGLYYPPQQPMYTPQAQQRPVLAQPPQPYQKRTKRMLVITDPNTGKNIMDDILPTATSQSTTPPNSGSSSSRATPVGNTPPPANNDIAAQFAAQVAATLRTQQQAAAQGSPMTQEQMVQGQMAPQGQIGQGQMPPGQVIGQPPLKPSDMVSPPPPGHGIIMTPNIVQQVQVQQQVQQQMLQHHRQLHQQHQQQTQLANQSQHSVGQQQLPPQQQKPAAAALQMNVSNAVAVPPTDSNGSVPASAPAAAAPPQATTAVAPPSEITQQSPPSEAAAAAKSRDTKVDIVTPVSAATVHSKSSSELSSSSFDRDSVDRDRPSSSASAAESSSPAVAAVAAGAAAAGASATEAWEPTPPSDNEKLSVETEKVCEEKTLEAPSAKQPSIEVTPATPKEVSVKSEDAIPEPKEQRDEGKDSKRKNRRQQLKELDNKKDGSEMDAFLSEEVSAPEPVAEKPTVNHAEEKLESAPVVKESSVDSKPVESKPVVSKPVESKPVDSKPVDSKPVDSKPVDSKPVDSKPVVSKPVVSEPVVSKPVVQPTPVVESLPAPVTIDLPDNNKEKEVAKKEVAKKEVPKKEVAKISPEKEVEKEAEVTKEVAEEQLSTDNKVAAENEKNKEKLSKEEMGSVSEENEDEMHDEDEDDDELYLKKDSKSKLRYNYPEDQWSPINMEGKKCYDRDFLLQLQYSTESMEKPDGLPKLPDVILDKPLGRHQEQTRHSSMTSMRSGNQSSVDFTPGFFKPMQSGGGGGGPGGKSGSMSRRSQQKDKGGQPRKVISVSLQQDIKLHHSDNAWKPNVVAKPAVVADLLSPTEEILKKVRSILNKLTPQKFQTLVQQILNLDINTEERLKGTIDLVFEKAIDEPGFSVAYAQLCKQLSNVKVPTDGDGKDASFRNLLLNRCQVEFEDYDKKADLVKEKEAAMDKTGDDAAKKKLHDELAEDLTKAKRRYLGNIRFIGELYKLQMLTEAIMHQCILTLLKSADEDSYECLCRLLATIGKDIDHEKAKVRIDQYFVQIDKIIKQKRTSSRIRFMLQDVYDLRKMRWVPRRADNAPKTIDQIHKEVQLEDQQRAQMLANMPPTPRGGGGNRRGGGRQGMPGQQGEDGWQVTKSSYRSNNIDPQKMRLSKHLDENNIQLGPGGRPGFNSWGRGSSGGGKTSSQEGERPATPGNRFSALTQCAVSDSSRTGGRGQTPSRDSKGRTATPRSKMGARASQEQDRESALSAVRSLVSGAGQRTPTGSRNQSRDSSRSREVDRDAEAMPPPSGPPSASPVKGLSDDEMAKKTTAVMDEYLHINDLKEAILCIKELESPKNMNIFVFNAINHVLERSPQARKQTGILLHDIVKQKLISVPTYVQGLLEVLEYADDMEVDIPKIWTYLGELIGPMVQDGCLPLDFLKEAAAPLKTCNKAGILVAEILRTAAQSIGNLKVGDLWRKSLLQWSDFITPEEVNDFVTKHKLQFTVSTEEPRSPEAKALSVDQITTQLEDLIIRRRADNEQVFDWIEGNVGEPKSKEAFFIRALMTIVCRSAIVGEDTGDIKMLAEAITGRSILLQKYLDHNGELELQALYALQALVHKLDHPAGLLRSFFDHLYDEDIISEDAFNQWDSSNDQAESAGKGVAKQSVLQFFIWLREAEDESQDDS